jgi:hypothetical protein
MRHHSSPDPRRTSVARCAVILLFLGPIGEVRAQDIAPPPPKSGLQVRSVSAYFDYYSSSLPNGISFQPSVPLLSDAAGGASVQVGWTQSSERTVSSFTYTSSLIGRIRYSEWNAWNHALSFTTNHKIAPRWMLRFSTAGDYSNQEQSQFAPTTLGNVASAPGTFDDLAAALLASKFSNPQLASAFAAAPLVESPIRNLLYGQRMFTAGIRTSLSYSYSPRLFLSFQADGTRSQHVSDNLPAANRKDYLLLNTTSGGAALTVSYSLSPHMQIGGSVASTRTSSSLQDAYTTTSLGTLGWTLARRWVLQVHGGIGVTNPVRQTSTLVSTTPHPAGGGSLAFRTLTQTFLGTIERTVSDLYGLGAATTSSAGLTWRWNRPGRSWWLESGVTWQSLQGTSLGNTSAWRARAGLGRLIGPHLVLFTQYAYLNASAQFQTITASQEQSAVRVSLMWTPHPEISR